MAFSVSGARSFIACRLASADDAIKVDVGECHGENHGVDIGISSFHVAGGVQGFGEITNLNKGFIISSLLDAMLHDIRRVLKLACILVLISGVLLAAWNIQREDSLQRENLLIKAKIAANTVSPRDLALLTGSVDDLESPVYIHLKDQMRGVATADPNIRFAYVMGMRKDGEVFFFVDSEPPDSKDYSPPGQVYTEATVPTLKAFSSGKAMTAGPESDRWGTWVTGFVPIRDPDTGALAGVFGLDEDARDWSGILMGAAIPPLLGTGLLLILLISFLVVLERDRKEQELRSASQKAIQESEERYRLLFTQSPVGIVQVDRDGVIATVNQKCAEILGMTSDELIGFNIRTQLRNPALTAAISGVSRGKPAYYEGEYQSVASGKVLSVRIIAHPIFSHEDEYSGSIAIIEDITERKKAEMALFQANRKLNLMNSITRHDILNQLLALKGYLELSAEFDNDSQQKRDFLEKARKAADNIERQIRFTKDYQDMGVKSATWQEIGLAIIRARGALPLEHLSIVTDRIEYEVFADPMFEKVFYNLFENSLKHGGKRLSTIRISARETGKGLLVLYEDDGVGIPDNQKKDLFMPEIIPQKGFGMFLAGQILSITGISIIETGVAGKGARFEILVPPGGYRKKEPAD